MFSLHRVPVLSQQKKSSTEESTTLAFYPVRAALPQLKAYLKGQRETISTYLPHPDVLSVNYLAKVIVLTYGARFLSVFGLSSLQASRIPDVLLHCTCTHMHTQVENCQYLGTNYMYTCILYVQAP